MATHEKKLEASTFITELSNLISVSSETNNFLLTGGNVIGPLVGQGSNLNDVDVVFDISDDSTSHIVNSLSSKGYLFTEMRPYRIEKGHEATVTTASRDNVTLDIAFVDDPHLAVGPLDSESMYYNPAEAAFIDGYGCMDAISKGEFRCIPSKSFDNENPYIIAVRALTSCAKYSASVLAQKPTIFDEFNQRKKNYVPDSTFAEYVQAMFPKKVLRSITKAKPQNRIDIVTEIIEADILTGTCDQTNKSLESILGNEATRLALQHLTTEAELAILVHTHGL